MLADPFFFLFGFHSFRGWNRTDSLCSPTPGLLRSAGRALSSLRKKILRRTSSGSLKPSASTPPHESLPSMNPHRPLKIHPSTRSEFMSSLCTIEKRRRGAAQVVHRVGGWAMVVPSNGASPRSQNASSTRPRWSTTTTSICSPGPRETFSPSRSRRTRTSGTRRRDR